MKKLLSLITFIILIVSTGLNSCGPTSDEASEYNNSLVELQYNVFDKENILADAMSKNQRDKLKPAFDRLCREIQLSYDATSALGTFDGTTELKDASLKVFENYKTLIKKDYPAIIDLYLVPDSLFTQETDDKIILLNEKIDSILDMSIEVFSKKQRAFAEKYRFELKTEIPVN